MKKSISVLVLLCLLLPTFQCAAWAADKCLPITNLEYGETYASGPYFEALVRAMSESAGLSPADRFVKIARSQEGYKGSPKTVGDGGTLSGVHNFATTGKYTEYSNQMGRYGDDWCSAFVSWCARAAGIPQSVIKTSLKATLWRFQGSYGQEIPVHSKDYSSNYNVQVKKGDLIFFSPTCKSCGKHFDWTRYGCHVAIVTEVNSSNQFKYIERNGNTVHESTTWSNLSDKYLEKNTCKCTSPKGADADYTYPHYTGSRAYKFNTIYRPDWSMVSTWSSSDIEKLFDLLDTPFEWKYSYASEVNSEKGYVRFWARCILPAIDVNKITEAGLVVDGTTIWSEKNKSNIQSFISGSNLDIGGTQVQFNFTPGNHEYYFYITYDGIRYQSAYDGGPNCEFILPLPISKRAGTGYYIPYNSFNLRHGCYEDGSTPTGGLTEVGYSHEVLGGYINPGKSLWYYVLSKTAEGGWVYEPNLGTYQGFSATVKRINNNNGCPLYTYPLNTKYGSEASVQQNVASGTKLSVIGEAYNKNGNLWYKVKPEGSDNIYWVWNDYLLDPDNTCTVKTDNGKTVYVQNDPEAGIFVSPALEGSGVMELPRSLTVIDKEAFSGTSVETVIIPTRVASVADDAFDNCPSLKYIVNYSDALITPPEGVTVIHGLR